MVDQSIENTGRKMDQVSADSGYSSGENLDRLEKKQIAYNLKAPYSIKNFTYNGTEDTYICPAGEKLHFSYYQKRKEKKPLRIYQCCHCEGCPFSAQCTPNKNERTISRHPYEKKLKAMREKLDSPEGKQIYGKRKKIVEPVFGIIKNVIGFTSFSLRGIDKVKGKFGLVPIAYKIKRSLLL